MEEIKKNEPYYKAKQLLERYESPPRRVTIHRKCTCKSDLICPPTDAPLLLLHHEQEETVAGQPVRHRGVPQGTPSPTPGLRPGTLNF